VARGDWLPCRGYGSNLSWVSGGDDPFTSILLATPAPLEGELEAASQARVQENARAIVVNRVVGCFQISVDSAAGDGNLEVMMRIHVGIYDHDNNQAAFEETSLFGAEEGEQPFLWQRLMMLNEAVAGYLSPDYDPYWTSLDVRVSRYIPTGMGLFLSIQGRASAGNVVRLSPWIRSWAHIAKRR